MASTPVTSVALTDGGVQTGREADRARLRAFLRAAAASPEARKLLDGRYPDPDLILRRIATGGFTLRARVPEDAR